MILGSHVNRSRFTLGTFTFKVQVTDNGSPVLYDEEQITVTVKTAATVNPTLTELEKLLNFLQANLYPNPVINKAILSWNLAVDEMTLTIMDIKGSVVYNQHYDVSAIKQLELPVQNLPSGTYVVVLQTKKGNKSLLFFKQ